MQDYKQMSFKLILKYRNIYGLKGITFPPPLSKVEVAGITLDIIFGTPLDSVGHTCKYSKKKL